MPTLIPWSSQKIYHGQLFERFHRLVIARPLSEHWHRSETERFWRENPWRGYSVVVDWRAWKRTWRLRFLPVLSAFWMKACLWRPSSASVFTRTWVLTSSSLRVWTNGCGWGDGESSFNFWTASLSKPNNTVSSSPFLFARTKSPRSTPGQQGL